MVMCNAQVTNAVHLSAQLMWTVAESEVSGQSHCATAHVLITVLMIPLLEIL